MVPCFNTHMSYPDVWNLLLLVGHQELAHLCHLSIDGFELSLTQFPARFGTKSVQLARGRHGGRVVVTASNLGKINYVYYMCKPFITFQSLQMYMYVLNRKRYSSNDTCRCLSCHKAFCFNESNSTCTNYTVHIKTPDFFWYSICTFIYVQCTFHCWGENTIKTQNGIPLFE